MSTVDIPVRTAPPPSAAAVSLLRRYRRLLLIESRRSAMPVLLPLVALLFYFDAFRTANGMVPTWTMRAAVIPNHVFADIGPFTAGLSAWMGAREKQRGMSDLLSTTPRPRWGRQVATWGACAAWTMLAYAGCVAVIYGVAATKATWGGPPWWPVVMTGLAVIMCCTAGFIAGSWFPSRFTAPLAAIAVVFIFGTVFQSAVGETGGITQISVSNSVPDPSLGVFYPTPPDVPMAQSICFAGVILALLGTLGFRGAALNLAPRRLAAVVALVGVAAAGTALGLVSTSKMGSTGEIIPALHDAASDRPIPFTPLCDSAAVPVCMHPAFQYEAAQVQSSLDPVLATVAGLPGAPVRAEQVSLDSPELPPPYQQEQSAVSLSAPTGGAAPVLYFGYQQQIFTSLARGINPQLQDQAAVSVLQRLIASPATADPAQQAVEGALLQAMGIPLGVPLRQALQLSESQSAPAYSSPIPAPGTPAYSAAKKFAALPAGTRHAWLTDHLAALRAGQITLAELP
jgi:ABC-type transport system involved in multi-copper enzyme maturation permease subunit